METVIRVLLLDDCSLTRAGVRAVLSVSPDIDIIGEAKDLDSAAKCVDESAPDVVVVNAQAEEVEPEELIDSLSRRCPGWPGRILMIVADGTEVNVPSAAVGTLMRRATPEEFVLALRMVAAGYSVFPSDRVGDRPVRVAEAKVVDSARVAEQLSHLTQRELVVLRLLAQGRTNAEISAELVVSESTVKSHVQHVLTKLGMRNRVGAAIYAHEAGILGPEQEAAP